MKKVSPIISPHDVKRHMKQRNCVLIDARGGPDAGDRFRSGHIRRAVFMDLETDLSLKSSDPAHGGRHPLPDPIAFGSVLGKAGIDPSTDVLVYDDKSGANAAARFWWMLKAAGHDSIQVVDGGLAALTAAGLPLSSNSDSAPKQKEPYPIKSWKLPLADMEAVDFARRQDDHLVIDVRENYRYRGESEPIDLIAGHIPGAVNIPFSMNLEPSGRFRSPEAVARLYNEVIGNREARDVIVHCGSGVTACHTLLAMAVAGLPPAALYVGSWSEWSRNQKPVSIE